MVDKLGESLVTPNVLPCKTFDNIDEHLIGMNTNRDTNQENVIHPINFLRGNHFPYHGWLSHPHVPNQNPPLNHIPQQLSMHIKF